MRGGELAWVVYPAGWNESTGGQQNIGIPESVVDRCDHLAPTLLRQDIVTGSQGMAGGGVRRRETCQPAEFDCSRLRPVEGISCH